MTPNASSTLVTKLKYVEPTKRHEDDGKLFGKYTFMGVKFSQELKYFNIAYLGFFHLVTLYVIFTYPWIQKWKLTLFSIAYGGTAGWGVTAGAHRHFTHKSYKATNLMKTILMMCYAAAGHNKIYDWVRDHRVHHKYSETDADPHNSNRGFFFSHIGWLMMKKHPEVTAKGINIDISDVTGDPMVSWYDKNFKYIQYFFCFILPTCFARYFIEDSWYWCIATQVFLRYIVGINFTWLVNSAAHLYGNRPFDKCINPRENLLVSIFAGGEGWHNYHHTFPWDYKASEYGKLNVTTFWIDLFSKLGLVYDKKSPSEELIKKVASRFGDGTHEAYGIYVTEDGDIRKAKD